MKIRLLSVFLLLNVVAGAARADTAVVVTTCGTLGYALVPGRISPLTMDISGNLCTHAAGGGGGGALAVTDGTTTVSPATTLKFTSGGTVTNAGGGEADVAVSGGGVSVAKVTLTAANLANISGGSPPVVIATPGVGNANVVLQSIYIYTFGGTAYTGGSVSDGLYYGTHAGAFADRPPSSGSGNFQTWFTGAAASDTFFGGPVLDFPQGHNIAAAENAAIVFAGATNYATGNGTLEIFIIYMTITP